MFGFKKSVTREYEKSKKNTESSLNFADSELRTHADSPHLNDYSWWGGVGTPAERIEDFTEKNKYNTFAINTYTAEMFKDESAYQAIQDLDIIVRCLCFTLHALHEYEYSVLNMKQEQGKEKPNAKQMKEWQDGISCYKNSVETNCGMVMTMVQNLTDLFEKDKNIPLYDFSSLLKLTTLRLERAGFGDSDFCKWTRSIDTLWKDGSTTK